MSPEVTLGGEATVTVRVSHEDAQDIRENQPLVDGSPLMDDASQYPLVAEGAFDSRGDFLIFATHGDGVDCQLEYGEFISAVKETAGS